MARATGKERHRQFRTDLHKPKSKDSPGKKKKTMAGIGELAKRASDALSKKAGKDIKVDPSVVKEVFGALEGLVVEGQTVSVQGLGNFKMVDRKATKARNPKTGESFDVGPSKRMKFTASKTLREALNSATPAPAPAAEAPAPAAEAPKAG